MSVEPTTTKVERRQVPLGGLYNLLSGRQFFEAAEDSDCNYDHFLHAQDGSADAHANAEARQIVKNRARYETANNPSLRGMTRMTANDIVGTGPRIQLNAPPTDEARSTAARDVEAKFHSWLNYIRFSRKLRTQISARRDDGEGIGIAYEVKTQSEKARFKHSVKLGYRLIDCDRLTRHFTDRQGEEDRQDIDGVKVDRYGTPIRYDFLKEHPYSDLEVSTGAYNPVSAKYVFHFFSMDRPEQHRGVSESQPGLRLAGQIRALMMSVVKAAKVAARMTGVIETDLPPLATETVDEDGQVTQCEDRCVPGDTMPIGDDELTCVPDGYSAKAFPQGSPNPQIVAFVKEALTQIGAGGCMPRNKSLNNSSDYNYSSGRLDQQAWAKCIEIERAELNIEMTRLFALWWELAIELPDNYIPEILKGDVGSTGEHPPVPDHTWYWDGFPHVDPWKESRALTESLRNGSATLTDAWAQKGRIYSEKQREMASDLGVDVAEYQSLVRGYLFPKGPRSQESDQAAELSQLLEELREVLADG